MRLLLKNTFKKIFKSLGRFLSMLFIIALGISVFIGLRESTASMLYTADNYYDKYNLMDYKVISSYGLTEGDVDAIKNLNNVSKVIPSYSLDVISKGNSIRINAIEKEINNVELIKGRMPKNNNECVADYYKYKIGDQINFSTKNLSDFIKVNNCKVVGLIKSVLYVRDEKGISNVGNGKLISYVFINKEAFSSEYYTEIYITAKGSKSASSYYKSYDEEVSLLKTELTELKPIRETIRYEEILKSANEKITNIRKELNTKLDSANQKLTESKNLLDESQEKLNKEKSSTQKEFDSNYSKLSSSEKQINETLNNYGISKENLSSYILSLNNQILILKDQLKLLNESSDEYKNLESQINEYENKYQNLLSLEENITLLETNKESLDKAYSEFVTEISKSQKELDAGYLEYNNGVAKLKEEESIANKKIEEAKDELNNIEKPEWYLLDRTDNSGYLNYKEDVIKVDSIAKVLPIFFIIVVMLMSSNTLSRLIEEERMEIGILQANGYSKLNIVASYLVYVMLAGFLGLGIGLTIGYSIIPKIIYGVFLSRYYVPKLITVVSPLPFSLVIVVTILLMTIVTLISCYKELKDVPANLLRPKPPKSGKKVFIEKIKPIWNKLGFTSKITIRNLFRYKKRIIMTVLGVAGCTALLLTGFGLNDSINNISKLQYKTIFKYDSMFILDNNSTSINSDINSLLSKNKVKNPTLINQNAYTYTYNNKIGDVYLVVPSNEEEFYKYFNLMSIKNDKNVKIENNGVVITSQLSEQLNAKAGDIISIRNSNNDLYFLYVTDVVENYVSHYIYMNQKYYKEIFGKDVSYNTIIATGKINSSVPLTEHGILTVNYTDDIIGTFDNFVSGLNKIIILILVSAGILAFIVLYNLTIINVSERKREIATLKVLGFTDLEISEFVYRESFILTFMGIIFGLFLGVLLHRFVIITAATDNIMFLRDIKLLSYIISFVVTIIFSLLVQLIINKVLKNINMIDSLKSVE